MEAAISLYLDENISPKIAVQLRRRGIDVVTAHDADALGDSDINHLKRAVRMERVLCTHDVDYLILDAEGSPIKALYLVFRKNTQLVIG
ncbi:MAG: DUF5615 family PIN-like protein [Anaerolineae bacterium]|nr:DUF5615 family PIN-like protein [Anaerolineae bacterium]